MVATAPSQDAFKHSQGGRPPQPNSEARVVNHTDFFGRYPERGSGPQAFLVEVEGTIFPHFHRVDQFQVIVGGGGSIGKHRLDPIAVHYVDRYTPYGPIVGPDDGPISFFTMRPAKDRGSFRMPGTKKSVPSGRSFTQASGLLPGIPSDGPERSVVIPLTPDGLSASSYRLVAGTEWQGPKAAGGGQYYVIASGLCFIGDVELAPRSLVWLDAGEEAPVVRAGRGGVELLVLQFPFRSGDETEWEPSAE